MGKYVFFIGEKSEAKFCKISIFLEGSSQSQFFAIEGPWWNFILNLSVLMFVFVY